MTRFTVVQSYRVPPDALVAWWLDYREDDVRLEGDLKSRKVERVDATHIHLVSEMMHGRRHVHLDGTVSVTGGRDWTYEAKITVDSRPFALERNSVHVDPEGAGGSKVTGTFEWHPRSLLARIALPLIKGSLRRERIQAYAGFARSIEAEAKPPNGTRG